MRIEGGKRGLGIGGALAGEGWEWRYICRGAGSPGKVDDSPTPERKREAGRVWDAILGRSVGCRSQNRLLGYE
jgi:hypothetical protein